MPSPIAHSLAGLALGRVLAPTGLRASPVWYACAVFAANAPDLDFVAGLAIGQVNMLHGGPTHSLGGALVFAALAGLIGGVLGRDRWRLGLALGAVYASHVGLDLLCGFPGRPTALAIFWPFSAERVSLPWNPLSGILHGNQRAGVSTFLSELFLPHNLRAFGVEALTFGSAVLLSWRFARPRRSPDGDANEDG